MQIVASCLKGSRTAPKFVAMEASAMEASRKDKTICRCGLAQQFVIHACQALEPHPELECQHLLENAF